MPTKKNGIRRVWINRYNRKGSDFYQPYDELPDLPDLSGLPALLGV
jgi:2-haloacid dehalogenase